MNATRRPPKKPLDPRRQADALGAGLERGLGRPDDVFADGPAAFADGVEAHRQYRRMCPETEAGCDLGPYVEPGTRPDDGAAHLGGPTRVIRFPDFFWNWFGRQSPATLDALDTLARRHIERAIIRKSWGRAWKIGVGGFVGFFAAMHWFSDQVAWIVERVPALRALLKLVTGG